MPKSLTYPTKIQITEPEVFIIESLSVKDEIQDRFEGKALRDSLRITGQRPAYYYVRTAHELSQALELFRHSGYRFLHLSLHGSVDSLFTTLEEITNMEFMEMCAHKLKNRRVCFSACEVGSGGLNFLIRTKNKGMYSIAAPQDKIQFGIACAFWTSFYTKALTEDCLSMKIQDVKPIFQQLCRFFNIRLTLSYYVPANDEWKDLTIE